jgi:hypothetical protein
MFFFLERKKGIKIVMQIYFFPYFNVVSVETNEKINTQKCQEVYLLRENYIQTLL